MDFIMGGLGKPNRHYKPAYKGRRQVVFFIQGKSFKEF